MTLSPAEITVMERMTVPEKTSKYHSHSSLQSAGARRPAAGSLSEASLRDAECGIPAFGSHIPPGVLASPVCLQCYSEAGDRRASKGGEASPSRRQA